ncbi:alpha/beta fold hydrolase [Nocardia sp. ET3-3]|uniref:Alpha/beta fold hydrolase n=1 Tax=Nocardia terrae TaxID=2675851 RepID=A0A7K1V2I7_9NOCA|nr:alpha/beta hydrolase [Nocardia terrae]MVU80328.1 alpha/beta fold hydrolase [Nocardia terrae]
MTIHSLTGFGEPVQLTVDDRGTGDPILLLHGGAGPISVDGLAQALGEHHRVLTPTHPGFEDTPRPENLTSMADLARRYRALLEALDLTDVTVVGNSIGGWIAAELALLGDPRVARVVLADAAGLDLPQTPIADFFALTFDQLADLSYCRPDDFRIDPSTLSPQRLSTMDGNRAALQTYGGTAMTDPHLLDRLPAIAVPTLVVWGECDRMIPVAHGHAFASAIPGARLELIENAGHLPQLETPKHFVELVEDFLDTPREAD